MKYDRFESLPVWKSGVDLATGVFSFCDTHSASFRSCGDLSSQLQRAALSVSNNIAEGFERGTTQELLTFLYIARGSAGEVRSMLLVLDRLARFSDPDLKSQISDLRSLAESISRQLRAWADSLQNSPIKGPRHLTDSAREETERKARAAAFLRQLDEIKSAAGVPTNSAG